MVKSSSAADKDATPTKRRSSAKSPPDRVSGHCALPPVAPRKIEENVFPGRESLIRRIEKKWVNNTLLRYCFLDAPAFWRGSEEDKQAVREAFQIWKDLPIGLEFREVHDPREAEIRIGFDQQDGSWSYLGRDAIDLIPDPSHRTMNFGWALTSGYGRDTALHEIGHALGFPHEHQNPNSGIVWDEQAVLDYFAGPPNNWDADVTRFNILRALSHGEVEGSDWDRNSVMHYQFDAGLIREPVEFRDGPLIPEPGLSQKDMDTARRFYPGARARYPELRPYESHRILMGPGEQLDFEINPTFSRDYTIQSFGKMDTVMVLFEDIDGEPQYMDGDDDSGWDFNAKIEARLVKGRKYFLRLRLYYAQMTGEGVLMMY
jgi:hypothetical protein